jgi:molybdate transport system substrate-binding protein
VAAASDLQRVFPALARGFAERTGRPAPEAVFGASGQLARQVEQGAPVDLFLSANRVYVEQLATRGVVEPATVRPYARGRLVVVVAEGVSREVATLDELARPEVGTIALADPSTAPYGQAAREVLEAAGLMEDVEPRLVLAESVREALQYARTGNAGAAFVSHALLEERDARRIEVDPALHRPIVQYLGVVAGSEHADDAVAFEDFLRSGAGASILAGAGFGPAE